MTESQCSVPGCGNVRTSRLSTPQKFHVFPSNPVLCREWLEAIENSRFDPKVTTVLMTRIHGLRVCSDHFRHQDYIGGQRNYYAALKRGAVPSLFPWTEPESETVPTTSLSQQQVTVSWL
uniref:THAP domain-containing protein 1 n=1 Tax=Seriola dumerili TaxID=41447 RepID=A0A3B4U177_SERDU